MKVVVTGVKGQLGYDVVNELYMRGLDVVGVDIEEMDIINPDSVNTVLTNENPDAVIHCAAYTAVDAAEDNEAACRQVNVHGTRNIAEICKNLDIPMLYISTDYVFDGQGERPWEPDDVPNPQGVYGQTKYEGELAVQNILNKYFIVRISWVFGINGKNFVKTMLRLSQEKDKISVVNDQHGSPTYTYDLAKLLADLVETDKYGIYHATNEGFCSWYDFAGEIFRLAAVDVEVIPVSSEEFPAKAKRPQNSRMSNAKLTKNGLSQLPKWQDALARYMIELKANL